MKELIKSSAWGNMPKPKSAVVFLSLMIVLIGLECVCADLAWFTVGELENGFLYFLVLLNVVPFILFFLKLPKIAVTLMLLLAVCIIPRQLLLRYRLHLLQQEATGIINYAKREKTRTGNYPRNLSSYAYLHPNLKRHITYSAFNSAPMRQMPGGTYKAVGPDIIPDFGLSIYVDTPTTPHIYTHSGGYETAIEDWWYYPD